MAGTGRGMVQRTKKEGFWWSGRRAGKCARDCVWTHYCSGSSSSKVFTVSNMYPYE